MKIQFDKDKFLKLLQEKEKLKKEGKSLWDLDEAKKNELIQYLTLLNDQIFWENRQRYWKMVNLFTLKQISLDKFFNQFFGLRSSNLKLSRIWKENFEYEAGNILTKPKANKIDFTLNSKSVGFTAIISDLHSWADLCDPEITFEMDLRNPESMGYGISEESFRLIIEEDFLPQLEKYCKES